MFLRYFIATNSGILDLFLFDRFIYFFVWDPIQWQAGPSPF